MTGMVSIKVEGETLTFKFGMGAWNILLNENGYKRVADIFGLDDTIVMPQVFHAGLEYFRRVNDSKSEPYTQAKVCALIDEMEQSEYDKVQDAFINSKYLNTSLKEMSERIGEITKEVEKIKKKKAAK